MSLIKQEDLKYTWTLSRRAWYIRFYLWLWEGSPDDITFCKLWWGYVLAPVGIVLRIALLPFWGVRAIVLKTKQRRKAKAKAKTSKSRDFVPKEPKKPKAVRVPRIMVSNRPIAGRKTRLWVQGAGPYEHSFWTIEEEEHQSYQTQNVVHIFAQPGDYEVEARTRDKYSRRHTIIRTIHVYERPSVAIRTLEGAALGYVRFALGAMTVANGVRHVAAPPTRIAMKPVAKVGKVAAKPLGDGAEAVYSVGFRSSRRAIVSLFVFYTAIVVGALYVDGITPARTGSIVFSTMTHPVELTRLAFPAVLMFCFGLVLGILAIGVILAVTQVPQAFGNVAAEGVKAGSMSFRDALRIGYVAVKTNTCPRVIVAEDEAVSQDEFQELRR